MYPVRNNDAVSEVIGSILLVSLVVIGVAIAAAVLWSQPKAEKIPEFSASISNSSCSVILSHTGGETVMNTTLRLLVDGTDLTDSFIKQGTAGPWATWGIGETLEYTPSYPCIITPKRVDIVYSSGSAASSISTGFFENPVSAGVAPRSYGAPMTPDFTGTPTTGFVPFNVQFSGTSTGSPISWSWDFGDGGTSSDQNPLHTYSGAQSYTVSLTVNNGSGVSMVTKTNYITVTPSPPWYCGWSYRKNITIDKSKVPSDQTNFPVFINLASDADLSARARSDGYDILFTSSDGTTKLSHEIETYTSGTGALVAWVKVPTLTSSANTSIYMYYGCATATNQQDRTNVWDADFRGVWHLKEDPSGTAPQMLDSTANAWHGTSNGAMTTSDQVAAIVNGGLDLDGSNDYISTNYVQTGVTAYTIEAWIKTSTISMQRVIVHDRGSGAGRSLTLSIGGTYPGGPGVAGGVGYGVDSDNIYIGRYSTTTVNNNNWHHLVGVWTAPAGTAIAPAQFSIYIDGTAAASTAVTVGTAPLSPLTGLDGTLIGRHAPWDTYLPSIIDEVRISNTVRNANWIRTEYNNQYSPSTFHYVMGQEQWTC
jgi:PKD repeat protein